MDEQQFSKRVSQILDSGLPVIEESTLARLRAARGRAMTAYREPISVLGLVSVNGRVFEPAYLVRQPLFWLPVLALAATVFVYHAQGPEDLYDETGTIDAKILAGELPPDALLDKDFAEWVKETSQNQ